MTKKILIKILIFIAGIATGVALTFLFAYLSFNTNSGFDGKTLFDKPGQCISDNSFQVISVLYNGDALAMEIIPQESSSNGIVMAQPPTTELIVLFQGGDKSAYYDDQIITIPAGKCVRQIGVYKYTSKMGLEKTVPIVSISNK